MNEADFSKRLISAQNEILALKTAHERGSSPVSLYTEDISLPMVADVTYLLTVQIAPDSAPNPLIQVLLPFFESKYGRFGYYETPDYPDTAYTFYRKVRWVRSQTFTFRVISSSKIANVSFSETSA